LNFSPPDLQVASASPLLAFDIGSPWMALWGLAAVAPLLIHLLSRRRFRQVPWAAMQFLLAAMRKESRRIRIEQWLLLAVRMAIILILAAALMDWSVDESAPPGAPQPRVHRVFVLDGSFSMAARIADKSRFDRGKELISEVLDGDFRQGDAASLVMMASPPRPIIRTPALDRDAVSREVAQLALVHGGADLSATLDLVGEVIEAARRQRAGIDRHDIYFISDLQRVTWGATSDGSQRAALRARFADLAETAELHLVDVGRPGTANVALTYAALADPAPLVGRENSVRADIKNFADQARDNLVVELVSENRLVASRAVPRIGGREQASVTLPYRFTAAGTAALELRLKTDAADLEIDNHRWVCAAVKDRLRVLCIAGKPGEVDFLPFAFEPASPEQAKVEVETATVLALRGGDLKSYDAIVLANVPQFSPEDVRRLAAYLDHGGGLIFFLGDQVVSDAYERHLGGSEGAARWWPVKLGEVASPGKYAVDPLGYRHRIAAPFQSQEEAGLLSTPIQRYVRMSLVGSGVNVALAIRNNGDPLVVEAPARKGRVVVIATAGSMASVDAATRQPWTYWPLWPSFLPIMQETLRVAVSGRAEQRTTIVGQPIGATLPGALPQLAVAITTPPPQPRTERVRAVVAGDETRWSYDETIHAGLYHAAIGAAVQQSDIFAVNIDPAESDLARVDASELPAELHVAVDQLSGTDFVPAGRVPRSRLYATLLYAVLALLLCETALAWWFGYHSS
jgi:hypothetical protein